MNSILLLFFGFITGLIDSIVGGGGLISLPFLSWFIAPGPEAIGTNKIVGTIGAFIALIVYARKGHLVFRAGILFCIVCAVGSYCGSEAAPHLPREYFKYLVLGICPIILYIVYNKDRFFSDDRHTHQKIKWWVFMLAAFGSGFYDGFFGPGGGTFMFLSLYLGTGFPILTSIAISKLANTLSAGTALMTYAKNGFVHWKTGLIMAIGMAIGSYIGASMTSKNAIQIVRPALTIVVTLLIIKLVFFS